MNHSRKLPGCPVSTRRWFWTGSRRCSAQERFDGSAKRSWRLTSRREHWSPGKCSPKSSSRHLITCFGRDPFSGHVVLRSTDSETAGSEYKLWTTVKVPQGFGLERHTSILLQEVGGEKFKIMPAKGIFTLGVGHVRRKTIQPGSRADRPAQMIRTQIVELNDLEWRVLTSLKREFSVQEVTANPWRDRAKEADLPLELFFSVAEDLDRRKIIGRFSTFLEHVKPSVGGIRVTRFNGLFHWAVPSGMEIQAGSEVGRHEILTHCYWREAGSRIRKCEHHGGGPWDRKTVAA